MSAHYFLTDNAASETLARALAESAPQPAVVFLHGNLGAGKSTVARAWLRHRGVVGAIRSPTYTLIESYQVGAWQAVHLDLYRIAATEELEFLGLDDLSAEASLWLVEWPERAIAALPAPDLRIELAVMGEGRSARIIPESPVGAAWLQRAALNELLPPCV